MRTAWTRAHLGMVKMFPRALSWVPPRRRRQVRPEGAVGPHTRVLARDEPHFHAWLGQNVPARERRRYAYLASPHDLTGFRGRVLVLSGSGRRTDATDVVAAVEARVQCGAVRWAA